MIGAGLSARMVAPLEGSFIVIEEELGPPPNLKGVFPVPAKVPAALGGLLDEA